VAWFDAVRWCMGKWSERSAQTSITCASIIMDVNDKNLHIILLTLWWGRGTRRPQSCWSHTNWAWFERSVSDDAWRREILRYLL
jgi:hypothetical protein